MISDNFKNRISVVTLSWTKFVDQNGIWAKAPENCTHLQYYFVDGVGGSMTYAEYKTLPMDQRILIQHAPSSP